MEPSHGSARPSHPPPLIAPGSIPTPTAVTLPPPLHPIPNPPLDSEIHQHPGKNLLMQQSSPSHLGGISRLPYPPSIPPLPTHHPHTSTPPSHHSHTPTPPSLAPTHRLSSTPPHQSSSSHLQHISTSPHAATSPHLHGQHIVTSVSSPHISHHSQSHPSSHYASSQHPLPHQRTNCISSSVSAAKNSKETAFVRPFEDNFPQQHVSSRRSPVVTSAASCGSLSSPVKERLASDNAHISPANECVTNSMIVSSKSHHVHHHSVSNSPSGTLSASRTGNVREEGLILPRTTVVYSGCKDNSNYVIANSDSVIQKAAPLPRNQTVLSHDGQHNSGHITITLDSPQPCQTSVVQATSQSFQAPVTISQPSNHISCPSFHSQTIQQSTGNSSPLSNVNQGYHSSQFIQDPNIARPQASQPGTIHGQQPLQTNVSVPHSHLQTSLQPASSSAVHPSTIQHIANREQASQPSGHQSSQSSSAFATTNQPSPATKEQMPAPVNPPPAVLNVPDASKVLAAVSGKEGTGAMSVWDYHYLSKSISSQRETSENESTPVGFLSKLDVAERRRRERRKAAGNNQCPASDSESEENDPLVSLWLTKGPPAKLDASPKKLKFLGLLGLVTLRKRNELEIRKLERRLQRNPSLFSNLEETPAVENHRPSEPSSLPTPKESPDSLSRLNDYKSKVRFLRGLGLESVSRKDREEGELVWQTVIAERLRRKCINSVVAYCSKTTTDKSIPTSTPEVTEAPLDNCPLLEESARLLKLIPEGDGLWSKSGLKRPLSPPTDKVLVPNLGQNGTRPGYHLANIPSHSSLLLQNGVKRLAPDREDGVHHPSPEEEKFKWPGVEAVMEAYQRHSSEMALELNILQEHGVRQIRLLADRRREMDALDQRLRELVARKSLQDYERHQTQQALDHLNSLLRQFR